MAAMNTLECILTVLNSCQERPDLFVGLESKLLPMLHRLLHPSGDGIEVGEKLLISLAHARKRGAGEEAVVSFLHRSSHSHPSPTLASPSPPLPSSLLSSSSPPQQQLQHLESVCQILAWLTFMTPPPLSSQLWTLFDMLYNFFMSHGFDYMPNMVSPLDSYIARGADVLFVDDRRPKVRNNFFILLKYHIYNFILCVCLLMTNLALYSCA
jgi:hypothetical protein